MAPKNTLRLEIAAGSIESAASQHSLGLAAAVLREGGTVAFPTETVYGLGANALDVAAVAGIFEAKQRPAWDPLIVHVSELAMLERVALSVPAHARKLLDSFWPGPLTLLLPKQLEVPDIVTAGRPLVGVRMPAHPVARALI
ncbi:MAG: L-threonylcarbamoyladenylate synthase, partial [Acidobacteriaceae bacterium]